jgi:hypothetical protein
MKKLLMLSALGLVLLAASGCRVCECWREAWGSRFRPQPQPQQAVIVTEQPCVVTDSCCSPCSSPCTSAPAIVPGPVPVH